MQKRKLGILLSTPPDHPNLKTVLALVEEACRNQVDTYLYLLDEGVKALSLIEEKRLSKPGLAPALKLFVCAYGAQRYHVSQNGQAVFCGLVVLSDLIKGCDRFIAFNA